MKELTIPIDEAGRIVLPKDVRQELAIRPGDRLKISVHGSSVTLTPNQEAMGLVRKGNALVFASVGGESLDHLTVNDLLQSARDERDSGSFPGKKEKRKKP